VQRTASGQNRRRKSAKAMHRKESGLDWRAGRPRTVRGGRPIPNTVKERDADPYYPKKKKKVKEGLPRMKTPSSWVPKRAGRFRNLFLVGGRGTQQQVNGNAKVLPPRK